MSTRVYEAIVSRWDAKSLGVTFPGGLWYDSAPAGEDYPFVRITSLGNVPTSWTSTSEHREQSVQFSIFYEETTGMDPVSAVGTLMRTLDAAISFAPLSITSSAGHVYDTRRTRDNIERDPQERIWMGVIDYVIMRRLAVNYSPT